MYIIGIDPGQTGAIAVMKGSGRFEAIIDMPVLKGKKFANLDVVAVKHLFKPFSLMNTQVVIEDLFTRPGEGAARSQTSGRMWGLVVGHLLDMDIPVTVVPSRTWTRMLGVSGKAAIGASASKRQRAVVLEDHDPSIHDMIRGPRGGLKDGRIDAGLIAVYGRKVIRRPK